MQSSEVVLKAHCAYWPKLTASSRLRSHQPLTPISESTECDHSESESNSESDSGSSTEVESDHPSSSSHTRIDTTVCVLHLPIIDLCLPSPETFPILLVHLHASTRPLVPKLLGISSLTLTRRDILVELEKFTLPELMEKLAYIHAMWKNVCALGISDEGTWNQMAMAWSCVVSVVAGMGGGWAWAEEMKAKAMA